MIENLRLNNGSGLTETLSQGFGEGFIGLADAEPASVFWPDGKINSDNWGPSNSLYNTSNVLCTTNKALCIPRYNNDNTTSTISSNDNSQNISDGGQYYNYGRNIYSYGNYYNYNAATASVSDYPSDTSICPKGWRLPTGDSETADFNSLNSIVGDDSTRFARLRSFPNNYVLNGFLTEGIYTNGGFAMVYWSSSYNGITGAYYLFGNADTARAATTTTMRALGAGVRCVAEEAEPPVDVCDASNIPTTMQEFTYNHCKCAGNSEKQLVDIRNNKSYTVRMIGETCWMTKNLNITGTITAANSNFSGRDIYISGTSMQDNSTGSYTSAQAHTATDKEASTLKTSKETIGTWYNFCAASALTVCNTGSGDAKSDICPAGWRLPNTREREELFKVANSNVSIFKPTGVGIFGYHTPNTERKLYFTYAPGGYECQRYNASFCSSDSSNWASYWWTSVDAYQTVESGLTEHRQHGFQFRSGQLSGSWFPRPSGHLIRCVAQEPAEEPTYTIKYDGNGATSGTVADQRTNKYVRTNYDFDGWCTEQMSPDVTCTGKKYTDGQLRVPALSNTPGSTVVLYALWKTKTYEIVYNDNGANSPTQMGVKHSGLKSGDAIRLLNHNYQRPGYGFAGWSFTQLDPDDPSFNTKFKDITIYGPGEAIIAPAPPEDGSNTKYIYAVWVRSQGWMQGWDGCKSMNKGDVTARTDKRDNQTYAIVKYIDNQCWMMENLRLDNTATTGYNINDPTVTNESLSQGYGDGFIGLAESEPLTYFGYNGGLFRPNSLYKESMFNGANAYNRVPRYNNDNTKNPPAVLTVYGSVNNYGISSNYYSRGNIYNWPALFADISDEKGIKKTSICPKDWRMLSRDDLYTILDGQENSYVGDLMTLRIRKYPLNDIHGLQVTNEAVSSGTAYGVKSYGFSTDADYGEVGKSLAIYTIRCISTIKAPTTYAITFNFDSGVSKVEVKDGSTVVDTVNISGGSVKLKPNKTYTIVPSYRDGYGADTMTKSSGQGTLDGSSFTVGTGIATIDITSKEIGYTIVYNDNGANSPTTMGVTHSDLFGGEEIRLYASNYQRPGYGFAGWSFTQINPDATNASTLMKNTKIYGPNETINAPAKQVGVSIVPLYAVWVKSTGSIQNWSGCSSMGIGDVTARTDQRDNNTYAIAKLIDGKCWMIENLRLGGASRMNLNSTTTNNPASGFVLPASSGASSWCRDGQSESCAQQALLYAEDTISPTPEVTQKTDKFYSFGNLYNWYTATAGHGKYTNPVNTNVEGSVCPAGWRLPSGGNINNINNSDFLNLIVTKINGGVLAPPGEHKWQEQYLGDKAEKMVDTLVSYPYNVAYSGYIFLGGSKYSYSNSGDYWSSTYSNAINTAYSIDLGNSIQKFIYTAAAGFKNSGFSVRCISDYTVSNYAITFTFDSGVSKVVIKDGTTTVDEINLSGQFVTISLTDGSTGTLNGYNFTVGSGTAVINIVSKAVFYMQDLTSEQCYKLAKNSSIIVYDRRDGSDYTVRFIDDACWMTQNLRITKSTGQPDWTISSTDSNFNNVSTWNIHTNDLTLTDNSYTEARSHLASSTDVSNIINSGYTTTLSGEPITADVIGVWYNFCAVSANNSNGCNNTGGYVPNSGSVTGDICPAGWHLPSPMMTPASGYYLQGNIGTSETDNATLFNPVLGGYFVNGNLQYSNSSTYWWTSNSFRNDSSYIIYNNGTKLSSGNSVSEKTRGAYVRCVRTDGNFHVTYTITYDDNGANSPTQTIIRHSNLVAGDSITLYASNYQRPGYGFAGWSFTQINPDAPDANTLIRNATIFGPNETITVPDAPSDGSNTRILYAVWVKSQGTLQSWTGCSAMNKKDIIALTDSRDNQTYAVGKLPDNKCWIIENLRLDSTATLNASNTDNPRITKLSNTTDTWCQANSDGNTAPTMPSYCANSSYLNTSNTVSPQTISTIEGSKNRGRLSAIYSYGNYYNWYSATAGTGTYSSISVDATGSICPKGWSLPSGKSGGEYDVLNDLANNGDNTSDAGLRKYPVNLIYSGRYYWQTSFDQTNLGEYWTKTAFSDNDNAWFWHIRFTNASHNKIGAVFKGAGATIRCVQNKTTYAITFTFDSGVSKVVIKDGTTTVDEINLSGQFVSYRDGYTAGSITVSSGSGTLNGKNFTVGNGAATINVASKELPYSIVYNENGANSPTTMAVKHSWVYRGDSITLYASNYQRPGYGFAGWSFTQINPDASDAATLIKNATIYGPNETIVAPGRPIDSDTRTLYAVWIKSAGSIQNWSGCSSMSKGNVTALTDQRDNNTYAVAKLADGKCWMIENLRLNSSATTQSNSASLSQGYGSGFKGLAGTESSSQFLVGESISAPSNSLYSQSSVSCQSALRAYCIPRYSNENTASTVTSMTSNSGNIYSYGNYYNFNAATASVSERPSGTSICPRGWRLPTGSTTSKDFGNLNTAVGDSLTDATKLKSFPNNFVDNGWIHNGEKSAGSQFTYYSSEVHSSSSTAAYVLYGYFNSLNGMPRTVFRTLGGAVRCISTR